MNLLDIGPFIAFGAAALAAELIARFSARPPSAVPRGQGSSAPTNPRSAQGSQP